MSKNLTELNIVDKIISIVFKRYIKKVYYKGFQDGFNYKE